MAPKQVAGTSGESFRAASAPEGRGMGALVRRGVLADGEGGSLQKAAGQSPLGAAVPEQEVCV